MHVLNPNLIDQLLEGEAWVVDFLPRRVPEADAERYFDCERFLLMHPQVDALFERFASVLLKLNCYYPFWVACGVDGEWEREPAPSTVMRWVKQCAGLPDGSTSPIGIVVGEGEGLAVVNGQDLYLSLFSPSPDVLALVEQLATAEGLFVRRGA